ncbi:MAG: bifunctional (p)ppGpp synthetase/guanosine-3',5'-bis(diphosphate) 3'-pyrophosphohydrolase, partial [Oscillospiraceae bacterium]
MTNKIYTGDDLIKALDDNDKGYDKEKILKAYELAKSAHDGQFRKSGAPYISHPIAVALILIDLGMDTDTIIASLLHDVVEDTDISIDEVKKKFGNDVGLIVDGVTKIGKIPFSSREEQQAENVRKMLLAMAQDVRVIITKLADRLHNMRTLEFMPPQKQLDISKETMEVYAPLAHRLGISGVKDELEDRALRFLDPIAYSEIERLLELQKDERHAFLEHIKAKIVERMKKENMKISLAGRVKSIYGIYRKVYMHGRAFEEIFDVYAVRIIVDTIADCYNILGIVHDMFTPIPNRFKDYISTPKNNMYQSLHTTLLDKEGIPFEIQIRTWDMHYTAEYGIAAHWKYKAGVNSNDKLDERLSWVRQLLETQRESEDVQEIVRTIKTDIASEEVYVFTPKGHVITLPVGATVIDFAYAIHTEVGNRMIGAKVDGRMVSLDFTVQTGMIIEVITTNSPTHGPSRDWLKIAKTTGARSKIRTWFKKEKREENISEGKSELERELRRNLITLPDDEMEKFLLENAKRYQFNGTDELYAAIGYGGILLSKVIPKLRDEYAKAYKTTESNSLQNAIQKPKKSKKASGGVVIEGMDDCLVKFSKCCNPLP